MKIAPSLLGYFKPLQYLHKTVCYSANYFLFCFLFLFKQCILLIHFLQGLYLIKRAGRVLGSGKSVLYFPSCYKLFVIFKSCVTTTGGNETSWKGHPRQTGHAGVTQETAGRCEETQFTAAHQITGACVSRVPAWLPCLPACVVH